MNISIEDVLIVKKSLSLELQNNELINNWFELINVWIELNDLSNLRGLFEIFEFFSQRIELNYVLNCEIINLHRELYSLYQILSNQ